MTQRRRHSYFAYGSNLCAQQMARRCPGAANPRRAVLDDHDWLINQRGVATVEPFDGTRVHGVVWDLSDHDLGALDRAESVPAHYRRDYLTVQTENGPSEAWVYIDHRVDPGPPRPGYLERIIDGALQHGLPQSWIDFLKRWDPSGWPKPRSRPTTPAPQTLSELLADPGVVEVSTLRSRFGFLAIHGGGLEEMTDVIAERAADAADASVYLIRHPDRYPHHLPSAQFVGAKSARLAAFLDHVDVTVSLHGYGRIGRSTQLLAGGRNRALAAHVARHLELPGHRVVTDLDEIPRELRGQHPQNPVNQTRYGGMQLELPSRVRGISPRSLLLGDNAVRYGPVRSRAMKPEPGNDGLSPVTSQLVRGLAAAARTWKMQ